MSATTRRRIIPYNPRLKELAHRLRRNGTMAEALLWRHLKGKQMKGHDFHRQKPIDSFIVDFFCSELLLAIEIDWGSHNHTEERDKTRQERLESLAIRFLRFTERDVRQNIEGVLHVIENWIEQHTPDPSEEGNNKGS